MIIEVILGSIGGLIFGGVVAWLLASQRAHAATEAASRDAAAAEASVVELRAQTEAGNIQLTAIQQALDEQRAATVKAETELAEARKNIDQQKQLLIEAEKKLTDTFGKLAADALKSSNESFLQLARESMGGQLKPLAESLKRYETHIKTVEESRKKDQGGLDEQLRALMDAQLKLRSKADKLANALRVPQVRGRWGEVQLRRVVELAGMTEHVDFETQVTVEGEDGKLRPDMIVHPPTGQQIIVDAKVPLDAYLNAIETDSLEKRTKFLVQHAAHVRTHVRTLAAKAYWDQFEQTPEFVVMFIPGESFFSAALEADATLYEDAMARHVMLASPMTLLALLRVVSHGWRQEQIAENARKISAAGRELHDRMRILIDHVANVGKGLKRANDAYNKAVGSLETRVLPSARRIKDLGAATGTDIASPAPLDTTPRDLIGNSESSELEVGNSE